MTPSALLTPGTTAPDFCLACRPDLWIALSDYRGTPVVLAFYPGDWEPRSRAQLERCNQLRGALEPHRAELVAISGDSVWSHVAFALELELRFPLLSDFQPRGAVASAFGVFHPNEGTSGRAFFVIDAGGVIRFAHEGPLDEALDSKILLEVLDAVAALGHPK